MGREAVIAAALIAAALIAGAIAAPAHAQIVSAIATPPAATITPAFFGMHTIHPDTDWPTVPFGSLAKGNCVQWPLIQSSASSGYNWATLDGYANAAAAHGATFTYTPGNIAIPAWATSDSSTCQPNSCGGPIQQCGAPPTVAHEQDLKNFFAALAARYCGANMSFELWNEPWDPGGMTAAQLAAVTTDEEAAIRSTCPNAIILSPTFGGDTSAGDVSYMQAYYAAGAPTDVNAVSLHIYTTGGPNNGVDLPESINPNTGHGIDYGNTISTIQQYLPNKPIWMTEGSYKSGSVALDFPTASAQAGYIPRYFLIQWALGFQRVDWYEWDNAAWGPLMPTSRSDGSSVPLTAYTQTYDWLVGRQMTSKCSTATPTSVTSTYTCGLAGAGGYKGLVAWITSGSTSFTPPSPATYTQYRDLAGNVTPYSGGVVTITTSPILFEN